MNKSKKIIAIFTMIAMLITIILLTVNNTIYAVDDNNDYTVNFGTAAWTVNATEVTAAVEGKTINNGEIQLNAQDIITFTGFNQETMQVKVTCSDGFNTTLNLDANNQTKLAERNADGFPGGYTLNIIVEQKNNNPGGQAENPNNYPAQATSTINYSVTGNIEYRDGSGMNPIGVDFNINNTHYNLDNTKANFNQNGGTILNDSITYGYDNVTNKVQFTFLTQWNNLITEIKINDQVINNLPTTREELIEKYSRQRLEIVVNNIDKADTYNIEIKVREQNDNEKIMGNFLWDYNANGGYTGPEDKIAHATLTFVKAKYNGNTYTTVQQINNAGGVYSWEDATRKTNYDANNPRDGVGSATFPVGTELTVKLIPDAGYQLVDFGINGGVFQTQNEIGTYTFVIRGGNFHLQANFQHVDDAVNTKSNKIDSGTISLGKNEASMNVGTARLDVDDATLNSTQKINFKMLQVNML